MEQIHFNSKRRERSSATTQRPNIPVALVTDPKHKSKRNHDGQRPTHNIDLFNKDFNPNPNESKAAIKVAKRRYL
jgi:hypothetical protein